MIYFTVVATLYYRYCQNYRTGTQIILSRRRGSCTQRKDGSIYFNISTRRQPLQIARPFLEDHLAEDVLELRIHVLKLISNMPSHSSSAARTNLTSDDVRISNYLLGEGTFRVCLEGTFVGGNRNNQEAACKRFKPQFRAYENEFFAKDFMIADRAIQIAEKWNTFCPHGKEILISYGTIHFSRSGIKYLVEPLIRHYEKFTSNSGWIGDTSDWEVRCMEAFSHYSYHATGGQMVVCDLQGRYRYNPRSRNKRRFELGDPAICSSARRFGPTDLGQKGMHSFFANHTCNEFCDSSWRRPRHAQSYFPKSSGTSMISSRLSHHLTLATRSTFRMGLGQVMEVDEDSSEDDSW